MNYKFSCKDMNGGEKKQNAKCYQPRKVDSRFSYSVYNIMCVCIVSFKEHGLAEC